MKASLQISSLSKELPCSTLSPKEIPIQEDGGKRLFDILFSLGVLVLLTPLFVLLALLVRLSSAGPIVYKSRRLGRGGRVIECWKFRSMYLDADARIHTLLQTDCDLRREWDAFRKLKRDPRVTIIGRLLRKTSLDELPQFWNVLKGDLSIVGPRSPALFGSINQYLEEMRRLYGDRTEAILSVRPGITGVWQVSGRNQISSEEKAKMEENYALHHTFWQDFVLLLKTIPAVLLSRGAF